MRRLEVAEVVLLAAAGLVAALVFLWQLNLRLRESRKQKPPELPLSQSQVIMMPTSRSRHLALLLIMVLCPCWRRESARARIEPAASSSSSQAEAEPSSSPATEGVASWRFGPGPASRALYTIDEEECEEQQAETDPPESETPFYTPATSPARLVLM